jgi:guanine deaminase
MLRTAAEAYKVLQLNGQNLSSLDAFHMMTRGNAEALGLVDRIGTLEPGSDADIAVLDTGATPAMRHRMETVEDDLAEELFVLMTLGDDRSTFS